MVEYRPAIILTLPLTPLLNRYYRKYRNVMVKSQEAKDYTEQVALICHQNNVVPMEGDICLYAAVYRKAKRGDLDGYLKGLLDSLQGYAYLNDNQIVSLQIVRHDDKHNPRVEVQITQGANNV